MRTTYVYPVVLAAGLWLLTGCALDKDGNPYANGRRLTYGQETAERFGGNYGGNFGGFGNRSGMGLFGWNRNQNMGGSACGDQGCGEQGCGDQGAGVQNFAGTTQRTVSGGQSQYVSTGGGKTQENISDYNYDCGPMCGAYLSDEQCTDNASCSNCKPGNSYVRNQWSGMFAGNRSAGARSAGARRCGPGGCGGRGFSLAGMRGGATAGMTDCGDCGSCAPASSALMGNSMGTCKGLGDACRLSRLSRLRCSRTSVWSSRLP